MKLRFRGNSLRLRVNQREARALADGQQLRERVIFPGDATLQYLLGSTMDDGPIVSFEANTIQVIAPRAQVAAWANGDDVGLYFELPAGGSPLKISIEKDFACVDGPPEERDPEAFPRAVGKSC